MTINLQQRKYNLFEFGCNCNKNIEQKWSDLIAATRHLCLVHHPFRENDFFYPPARKTIWLKISFLYFITWAQAQEFSKLFFVNSTIVLIHSIIGISIELFTLFSIFFFFQICLFQLFLFCVSFTFISPERKVVVKQ